MRSIQMTLDEELVAAVDKIVKELNTTRSAFTRDALQTALDRIKLLRLEEKHQKGYLAQPVNGNEFSVWENEHAWGDE